MMVADGIFLVFAAGGLFGFGIYYYLDSQKNSGKNRSAEPLAQAPIQPEANTPQRPRDPTPPLEPSKKDNPAPLVEPRPEPRRNEPPPQDVKPPRTEPSSPNLPAAKEEPAPRPRMPIRVPDPAAEPKPPPNPTPPPDAPPRPAPKPEPPANPVPPSPPKSEPKPPKKEEPQLDERLTPLVKALKSKKAPERLRAVLELGKLKDEARPVDGTVCEVLVSEPIPAVRQAALEALEKIHPELHAPVVVFIVEADAQKHIKAARDVGALGEQGRPAAIVLLSHLQAAPTRFSTEAPSLINADAQALAQIAPDEPVVQKTLIELTRFTFTPPRHRSDIGGPTREAAARVLGGLLDKHPEQAERVAPGLLTATRGMTDEKVRGQAVVLLGKLAENHVKLRPQIAEGLLPLASAGDTTVIAQLGKCGRDAQDALPLLKKLKLHPMEAVRTAANKAIQQIEEAVASAPPPRTDEPKTSPEPKPRTEEAALPRDLRPLVEQLKNGTTEERVKAAGQLADLGEKAQPAARALCDAALSPSQKISRAALQALEKADPELYKSVFVLLVDEKAANHLDALKKLSLLAEQGKPATPIVLHEIKRCQELLNVRQARWGQPTLLQVTGESMKTLPKIAADDPKALKTIIDLTKFSLPAATTVRTKRGFVATEVPFREERLTLLGGLAEEQPGFRKQIITPVVSILKEAVQRTSSPTEHGVLVGIAEVEHTGNTLLKCGEEAKPILKKEVLPRLKDLQFHKSDNVRKTAEALRKKIEDEP